MYESRSHPLLPRSAFAARVFRSVLFGGGLVAISLFVGMLGYHVLEGLSWVDAFLNAAMILGGMGPVAPLATTGGKLFAGFYALYSGLAIISIAAVIFAPVFHRFLHRFHLAEEEAQASPKTKPKPKPKAAP